MELEKGTLYLVGTPIGNLDDMTYRAVEVLSQVDLVAAEDTRNSQRLLHHFDIKKPLISYFEHNKAARGEVLLRHLKEGKTIALMPRAGHQGEPCARAQRRHQRFGFVGFAHRAFYF